jgi:hypothetical protein
MSVGSSVDTLKAVQTKEMKEMSKELAADGSAAYNYTTIPWATNKPGLIYKKIPDVMRDIGAIGKDRVNEQQKFKFRGIEDLYNAAHPVLAAHGVFCAPGVLDIQHEVRETRSGGTQTWILMRVQHRFFCEDGSYVDVVTTGEGLDSSDKAANKCMSAAFKYALMELLCIPMADIEDSDRTTPENGKPVTKEAVTFKRPTTDSHTTAVVEEIKQQSDAISARIVTEAVAEIRRAEPPKQTRAPRKPVSADPEAFISLEQQDYLRMKFIEALPAICKVSIGMAESLRHGWLQENGFMDADGVGTSKVIKNKQYRDVFDRMIEHAKDRVPF